VCVLHRRQCKSCLGNNSGICPPLTRHRSCSRNNSQVRPLLTRHRSCSRNNSGVRPPTLLFLGTLWGTSSVKLFPDQLLAQVLQKTNLDYTITDMNYCFFMSALTLHPTLTLIRFLVLMIINLSLHFPASLFVALVILE